jgi:UDP-2,3-diacylglucosamine pyrophosphatase LpxH
LRQGVGLEEAKMASFNRSRPARVRTLFLSDIHLGFKRSRAAELADFLLTIDADTIVLVGDIIDALSLSQRFFWSAEHSRVVQVLLAKRRAGARLLYIPGNHDAALAPFAALLQGQLEVQREWVHCTVRGERFLVLHGDQFDGATRVAGWLHRVGEAVYDLTIVLNDYLNDLRRMSSKSYWPLAASATSSSSRIRRSRTPPRAGLTGSFAGTSIDRTYVASAIWSTAIQGTGWSRARRSSRRQMASCACGAWAMPRA